MVTHKRMEPDPSRILSYEQLTRYFPRPENPDLPDGAVKITDADLRRTTDAFWKDRIVLTRAIGVDRNIDVVGYDIQRVPGYELRVSSSKEPLFHSSTSPVVEGMRWHRGYALSRERQPERHTYIFLGWFVLDALGGAPAPQIYADPETSLGEVAQASRTFFEALKKHGNRRAYPM